MSGSSAAWIRVGRQGGHARTIKPREVSDLLDGIGGRGSPVQANRTATYLGQMFKFGIHRAIVDDSPVKLLYKTGWQGEVTRSCAFRA